MGRDRRATEKDLLSARECHTMNFRCEDFFSAEGLGRARIDTNIRPPKRGQYTAGIGCRIGQVSITVTCADPKEVQCWVVRGDEDCEHVLLSIRSCLRKLKLIARSVFPTS